MPEDVIERGSKQFPPAPAVEYIDAKTDRKEIINKVAEVVMSTQSQILIIYQYVSLKCKSRGLVTIFLPFRNFRKLVVNESVKVSIIP